MVKFDFGRKKKENPPEKYTHRAGGRLLWGWITPRYQYKKQR